MAVSAERRIYVKGDPVANKLGDCPFCHRALLTLELKGLDYEKLYVDFNDKPEDLFVDNPDGKVPVLLDGDTRVPDSGAVVQYLDEKYPDAQLGDMTIPGVGEKLFPSFVQMLKAGTPEERASKEPALLEQLQQLDEYLADNGPFLCGDKMGAADAVVAPRMYHLSVALPHFRGWQIPECFPALLQYCQSVREHPAFKATDYGADMIIKGWEEHM